MKKILFILSLLFLMGCESRTIGPTGSAYGMQLSTDKNVYHSNEIMNITIDIQSNTDTKNMTLRIYGIYSGKNRLERTKTITLKKGANTESITYKTPRCTGCAGIRPGTYKVNAQLKYNNTLLVNTSNDIDIAQ